MFRWQRNLLALFLTMILLTWSQMILAQADDEAGDATSDVDTPDASGDDADDDDADDDDADDGDADDDDDDADDDDDDADDDDDDAGDDDDDADDDDDDDDAEGDDNFTEEAETPDDLELDYEALGEMDPEEELNKTAAADGPVTTVSEDWTQRNLELFEVHGYFRVRPGLYNKFHIRNDRSLFPLNADRQAGCRKSDKCKTLAGADMRFLFAPTINLSEEVRVNSELIFFDNMMMGSTPSHSVEYGADTSSTGEVLGYSQRARSGDYFTMSRVWGEMEGPIGHLRFGRMPSHWGTGMLYNSGDKLNDDLGDSVDRISFEFKLNGWMIMPAFDFPNEGLSLESKTGRPFDVSQLDEGYRIVGVLAYQHEKEDQKAMLKQGDWLINTGLHFSYRSQAMNFHWTGEGEYPNEDIADDIDENQITAYERGMWTVTPDLWFQFLYDTFHLELELAFNFGQMEEPQIDGTGMNPMKILSWGGVVQVDYGLLSDQLRLGVEFGIASGDKDVEGLNAPNSFDQANDASSNTFSVFSFNPAYSVDSILYRHILGSVSGTYYFKPWLRYDFLKAAMGKNLGVQLDVVFARAMYDESTISNSSGNLGIELDARVDFITADRFYASLKYGVLFPLNGFKGTYEWEDADGNPQFKRDTDLTVPQTLQMLLGITF